MKNLHKFSEILGAVNFRNKTHIVVVLNLRTFISLNKEKEPIKLLK